MFNWVCPQCGKDVPPSKTECPNCAERAREAAAAGPVPPPPPPPPAWQPPPPVSAGPPMIHPQPGHPPQWGAQPPQPYPPTAPAWPNHPPRAALPTWLMGLLFALAFLGLGAIVYFGIQRYGRTNTAEKAGVENPANPSQQKVSNTLQKYIEVVGIRVLPVNKKPSARFLVVNHSNAEITDLAANVTVWASTSRSEEDSVGSFSFKIGSLAPNGSQELTQPLKTKLKVYELPDWQNATAELQITSPQ